MLLTVIGLNKFATLIINFTGILASGDKQLI